MKDNKNAPVSTEISTTIDISLFVQCFTAQEDLHTLETKDSYTSTLKVI